MRQICLGRSTISASATAAVGVASTVTTCVGVAAVGASFTSVVWGFVATWSAGACISDGAAGIALVAEAAPLPGAAGGWAGADVSAIGGASGIGMGGRGADATIVGDLPGRTLRGSTRLINTRPESDGAGGAGGTKPQAERRQATETTVARRLTCMGNSREDAAGMAVVLFRQISALGRCPRRDSLTLKFEMHSSHIAGGTMATRQQQQF